MQCQCCGVKVGEQHNGGCADQNPLHPDGLIYYGEREMKTVEEQIQEKGLNAPRVTPAMVEESILMATYTVLPSGRTTICELTMQNGFTVRGESSVVSSANFDEEVGKRVALENAKRQIWPLLGYALRDELYRAGRYD